MLDVAYSTTVPAPQPDAEIVPTKEGSTLLTIESVGAFGKPIQTSGAVVTATDAGLLIVASLSQLQRV